MTVHLGFVNLSESLRLENCQACEKMYDAEITDLFPSRLRQAGLGISQFLSPDISEHDGL